MARYLSEEWIQYCHDDQREKVTACLTLQVDVNTVSEDGRWSCLTIAAEKNNLKLVDLLLSQPGVRINQTTGNDWTALMLACRCGNPVIVSRLVKEKELDINAQDVYGNTAAHFACANGFTECLRVLAETRKVKWDIEDRWGNSPLGLAQMSPCIDVSQCLDVMKIISSNYNE